MNIPIWAKWIISNPINPHSQWLHLLYSVIRLFIISFHCVSYLESIASFGPCDFSNQMRLLTFHSTTICIDFPFSQLTANYYYDNSILVKFIFIFWMQHFPAFCSIIIAFLLLISVRFVSDALIWHRFIATM